jgi:peptidoglycan/LPS O-acetylase OafA/YrhL
LAFNPRLHSLRGIAALAVVLFHWSQFFPGFAERFGVVSVFSVDWPLLLPVAFGWLGVPLFFVLSGYLLGGQLLQGQLGRQRLLRFWQRRALRIYPAVWAQCLVFLAVALSLGAASPYADVSVGAWLRNALLWVHLPPDYTQPLNGVWWTLPVELMFYLLLPLLIILTRCSAWYWVLLASVAVALVWRWGVIEWLDREHYAAVFYYLDALPGSMAAFAGGLALNWLRLPTTNSRRWACLLLTLALLLALQWWLLGRLGAYWSGDYSLVVWVPLVSLLIAIGVGLVLTPLPGLGSLSHRLPVWLGEVSFGIYLWHLPLQLLLLHVGDDLWAGPGGSLLALAINLVATLALAALSYYGLERPLMGWRRSPRRQPASPPGAGS